MIRDPHSDSSPLFCQNWTYKRVSPRFLAQRLTSPDPWENFVFSPFVSMCLAMKNSDRPAKKTVSRSFIGSYDFGLLLPATYSSASPKSQWVLALTLPSQWLRCSVIETSSAMATRKNKRAQQPLPALGALSKQILKRSGLEKSSIWKLAPRATFAARPVCLSPKDPAAPGTCSVALAFSQKHASLSMWWNFTDGSSWLAEGLRCTQSHLRVSPPQNGNRSASLLQTSTQLKRASDGFKKSRFGSRGW